jgi:hypothetical protein
MRYLITTILILSVLVGVRADEDLEIALDCVADATDIEYHTWLVDLPQWDDLLALEGASVWVGYSAGGWDVPEDIHNHGRITGTQYGERIEVWVWHSDQADRYYLFPFSSMRRFADKDGNHWGVHPCGGFEVVIDGR